MGTKETTVRDELVQLRGILNRVQYDTGNALQRNEDVVIYSAVSSTKREIDDAIALWRSIASKLEVEY